MVAVTTTAALLRFASRNGTPRHIHLPSPKPADRRRTLCPSNTPWNRERKEGEEEEKVIFPWYFSRTGRENARGNSLGFFPFPPSPNSLLPTLVSSTSFLRLCVRRALWRSGAWIRRFTNPRSYRCASPFLDSLHVQLLPLTMLLHFRVNYKCFIIILRIQVQANIALSKNPKFLSRSKFQFLPSNKRHRWLPP